MNMAYHKFTFAFKWFISQHLDKAQRENALIENMMVSCKK